MVGLLQWTWSRYSEWGAAVYNGLSYICSTELKGTPQVYPILAMNSTHFHMAWIYGISSEDFSDTEKIFIRE